MSAFKASLTLEAMESREVPAVIGWVKAGPRPEPPTTPPAKVYSPPDATSVAGYTNPCFIAGAEKVAPNGILFPVFVGR